MLILIEYLVQNCIAAIFEAICQPAQNSFEDLHRQLWKLLIEHKITYDEWPELAEQLCDAK